MILIRDIVFVLAISTIFSLLVLSAFASLGWAAPAWMIEWLPYLTNADGEGAYNAEIAAFVIDLNVIGLLGYLLFTGTRHLVTR